jgi:hypothetical protein
MCRPNYSIPYCRKSTERTIKEFEKKLKDDPVFRERVEFDARESLKLHRSLYQPYV